MTINLVPHMIDYPKSSLAKEFDPNKVHLQPENVQNEKVDHINTIVVGNKGVYLEVSANPWTSEG